MVELSGSLMLALMAHVHTVLSSPKACLSEGRNNDDNDDYNNECQHLMFDDRFFPVAIFITVRSLSSSAREQSHGVSHMESLSKQLIWFLLKHRDCRFIMFLSAASVAGASHGNNQLLK